MPNELTNPNNVVTEERLAQFYQQILPYLGGMPDILANKFNRADLYSTDEKLIGRWIDGKPMYQKVIALETAKNISANAWTTMADVTSDNVDMYVDVRVITNASPKVLVTGLFCKLSGSNLQILSSIAVQNINRVIVSYTKTTDSAVEIGDDTDYSTTEKIVGTWIDGKPIWQKTIIDACTIPGSSGAYGVVELGTDKQIIDYDGYVKSAATNGVPKYLLKFGGYSSNGMNIYLNDPMGSFHIFSSGTDIKNKPIDLTVRYIKLS